MVHGRCQVRGVLRDVPALRVRPAAAVAPGVDDAHAIAAALAVEAHGVVGPPLSSALPECRGGDG